MLVVSASTLRFEDAENRFSDAEAALPLRGNATNGQWKSRLIEGTVCGIASPSTRLVTM